MPASQPEGYLAAGTGPGVLVLHPWWGLNDTMRQVCDRLAAEGYLAYAPDLYHGRLATTIDEAERLSDELDPAQAKSDVAAAADLLWARAAPAGQGLAVLGFSLGAYYALQLSVDDPDRVAAVVLFYGTGDGDFSRARAAYLGHYAGNDPYEPAEYVDWLEGVLRDAGRPVTFHRYAGLGHWFFEADRPDAYDQPAAQLAWQRTLAFLRHTLSG
jgi:carboxymethylenebutenolidase